MDRYELRLSGMGGQGLVLAGIILAEAAMAQGLNVVQTASYGPESRGGASRSEVIISSTEIDYPAVIRSDYLLAMTQEAADRFAPDMKSDGVSLYDTTWVKTIPQTDGGLAFGYQLTETAIEKYQKSIFANIIGLGIVCRSSGVLKEEILLDALLNRVPKKHRDANKMAFELGMELYDSGKPRIGG